MSIRDEKAADLAAIIAEIGEPVRWKQKCYPALISEPTISEHLELGGFVESGDFTIKIMRSAFTGAVPVLGEIIEFQGERFRIGRITNHPNYPMIVLMVSPAE